MSDGTQSTFPSALVVLSGTDWTFNVPYDLNDHPIAPVSSSGLQASQAGNELASASINCRSICFQGIRTLACEPRSLDSMGKPVGSWAGQRR